MSLDELSKHLAPDDQRYFDVDDEVADIERARYVVLQAPYEKTVSYGAGTSLGPAAIMRASQQVEFYDEEMDREATLESGVATLAPLNCDCSGEEINERIYQQSRLAVQAGKVPVLVGGEHTVSYGNVRACAEKHGESFSILHIDAHSDLRDTYMGQKFNHATAAARFVEFAPIVQVGIRSRETSHAKEGVGLAHEVHCFHGFEIAGSQAWIDDADGLLKDKIYITVDVDGFDPSVFPGTGTPEPGGLDWWTGLKLLRRACEGRELIGFDIVEVAPLEGSQQTEFAAARLMAKIIAYAGQA